MDPMQVNCPTCNRLAGERCRGVIFGAKCEDGSFAHMARAKLAKAVEDEIVADLISELEKWGHDG